LLSLGARHLGPPRGFPELKALFGPKGWACLGGPIWAK
jgi:hypothetical protein